MKRKEIAALGNSIKELSVKGLSSKTIFELLDIKVKLNNEIEYYVEYQKTLVSDTRPEGYSEGDKIPEHINVEWNNRMNIILDTFFNTDSDLEVKAIIPKDEFVKFISANEDSITIDQLSYINKFLVNHG